ncbi:hypothetical protein Mapa_009505 [Marchantia paleacea]|nr:hypothetical protein Mapa_009505 [Marchantia paleacea]
MEEVRGRGTRLMGRSIDPAVHCTPPKGRGKGEGPVEVSRAAKSGKLRWEREGREGEERPALRKRSSLQVRGIDGICRTAPLEVACD